MFEGHMEIGVGLDYGLNLTFPDQDYLSQEAASLGYSSIWTTETNGQDSFQVCSQRWSASRMVIPEGLKTGISVSPVLHRTPVGFAMSAGTMSLLTGGRFILGLGSGLVYQPRTRHNFGLPRLSALAMMRDYLITTRALLAGETVNYEGPTVTLRDVKLDIKPPPATPVHLAALGPEMLRLAGELADGVALNWHTPKQREWARERIAEGAAKSGRDPTQIELGEYIRVCIDEDEDVARRGFAKGLVGHALGPRVPTDRERTMGYRAHFERLGFGDDLDALDQMRNEGASRDQIIDAFPEKMMRAVGYYGPAADAAKALRDLSLGLDIAIVRVLAARPGLDSVMATMRACRPELLA